MPEAIVPFDLMRMFLGDAPPLFLLEIAFRTLFIYAYTLVLLRWIGGRSIAQLSIVEFLLVIALGSAVGDSLFYPDVPLIHAMIVIALAVSFDKLIDLGIRRYAPVKRVVDGQPVAVVVDGRMLTDGLLARVVGAPELMEMLRMAKIENLGQVRAAYLETSGQLSVFRAEPPRPGLSIVPPHEVEPPPPPEPGQPEACVNCGGVMGDDAGLWVEGCPHCTHPVRTVARLADNPGAGDPGAGDEGGQASRGTKAGDGRA